MKRAFSLLGLLLLLLPLLRHITFEERIAEADSAPKLVATLRGIGSGLTCGFFGLMILGFVCDGGRGFRSRSLFIAMTVLGSAWCYFYPSGWLLGVPLIVYSVGRRLGASSPSASTQKTYP